MKIFDIYLCHYSATPKKIAITHLWHAIEPRTMYQLIAKEKVAEQYIVGKYSLSAIVLQLQWIYSTVTISK